MKKAKKCFDIIMIVLIVVFLCLLIFPFPAGPFASQKTIIFYSGQDMFADFFNVLRYMSDEAGFYWSKINESDGHGGFPFGLIFMYPFMRLVDYSDMTLQDCWTSRAAMLSCMAYLVVLLFVFWRSLYAVCKKYRVPNALLWILLFSSVNIFSVERANGIFLSAALINYYLVYYDSKKKEKKYFALICICIAAVLKGYPVLFGLLLLQDRRFKDIAFCIVFTLAIAFVPFAFMRGGFFNLPKMLANIGLNNAAYIHNYNYMYGLHKLTYMAGLAVDAPGQVLDGIVRATRIVETVFVFLTIGLILLDNKRWRQMILIVCAILLYPINSGFYCGLYLFPALLFFFKERKCGWPDYVMVVLFCIILNPVQINFGENGFLMMAPLLSNMGVIILWLISFVWAMFDLVKRAKNGKVVLSAVA